LALDAVGSVDAGDPGANNDNIVIIIHSASLGDKVYDCKPELSALDLYKSIKMELMN
jgi:hypothetical protein